MEKGERARTSEVYVSGFVPSYLLPKKRAHSLDPFLHPLISEIEDIFINGITIIVKLIIVIIMFWYRY